MQHDWSEENGKRKKALVISTSSYTRAEYDLMERYRRAFLMCENYAVLRQVSRFVRHETGITEMELYARLADTASEGGGRWPAIEFTFTQGVHTMVPPVSWRLFVDEVGDFVHTRFRVANDSALRTVLDVQHALLPARDREFPFMVELDHDYAAWHQALLDVKRGGHTIDWRDDVPRLSSFGPATFAVDDPQDVSRLGVGMSLFYDTDADWELQSPVARPMRFRHTIHA